MQSVYSIILKLTGAPQAQSELETVERSINIIKMTSEQAGQQMVQFGQQLDGVLGQAKQKSAEMERGISNLANIMGVSVEEGKKYNANLGEILDRTGNQISRNDALSASYDAASAGYTDAASAASLLEESMKLAIVGTSGLQDSTANLTASQNAIITGMKNYGDTLVGANTEQEKFAMVSDRIYKVVKLGITDIAQLAPEFAELAPSAANAGMSIEELAVSFGVITSTGIKTTQATTLLKGAILSIAKGGGTEEAKTMIKDLGLEFDQTTFKTKGFTYILQQLKDKGVTDLSSLIKLTGNMEAASGLGVMIKNLDKVGESLDMIKNTTTDFDSMVANKVEDGMGRMTAATNKFNSELALAGGGANTFKAQLLEAATNVLIEFNKLDDGTKTTILQVASLTTGVAILGGGMLVVASQVATAYLAFGLYRANLAKMVAQNATATASNTVLGNSFGFVGGMASKGSLAVSGLAAKAGLIGAPIIAGTAALVGLTAALTYMSVKIRLFQGDIDKANEKLSALSQTAPVQTSLEKLANRLKDTGEAIPDDEFQSYIALANQANEGNGTLTLSIEALERMQAKAKAGTLETTEATEEQGRVMTQTATITKEVALTKEELAEAEKKLAEANRLAMEEMSRSLDMVAQNASNFEADLAEAVNNGTITQNQQYQLRITALNESSNATREAYRQVLKASKLSTQEISDLENKLTQSLRENDRERRQIQADRIQAIKADAKVRSEAILQEIEITAYEQGWRQEELTKRLKEAKTAQLKDTIAILEKELTAVAAGSEKQRQVYVDLMAARVELARQTGSINQRTAQQDAEDAAKALQKKAKEADNARKKEAKEADTARKKEAREVDAARKKEETELRKAKSKAEKVEKDHLKAVEKAEKEASRARKDKWDAETEYLKGVLKQREVEAKLSADVNAALRSFDDGQRSAEANQLSSLSKGYDDIANSRSKALEIDVQISNLRQEESKDGKSRANDISLLVSQKKEILETERLTKTELDLTSQFLKTMGVDISSNLDNQTAQQIIIETQLALEKEKLRVKRTQVETELELGILANNNLILEEQQAQTREGITDKEVALSNQKIANLNKMNDLLRLQNQLSKSEQERENVSVTLAARGKMVERGIDPSKSKAMRVPELEQDFREYNKKSEAAWKSFDSSLKQSGVNIVSGVQQSTMALSKSQTEGISKSIDPLGNTMGKVEVGISGGFGSSVAATQAQTVELTNQLNALRLVTDSLPGRLAAVIPRAPLPPRK